MAFRCVLAVVLLASCTKANKEFCCTSAEDCQAQGVNEDHRDCNEGLACVDHSCAVPACASAGCGPEAPTCDIHTDVCAGCNDSTECARFPTAQVCDPNGGACVECLADADCGAMMPVCEHNACRGCQRDSECDSGACGDDGSCVATTNAVYLSPTGTDAVPCSQSQPCQDLLFALKQTTDTRSHLVLDPGSYVFGANPVLVTTKVTLAQHVYIHGHGAHLQGGGSDGFLTFQIPATVRDAVVSNPNMFDGAPISAMNSVVLENLDLQGYRGLSVSGQVTATDIRIQALHEGIRNTGVIKADRLLITGGDVGIISTGGNMELTNTLIYGASGLGLDLDSTGGSMSFSTIADTGVGVTGIAGANCTSTPFTLRASIVWTPTPPSNRDSTQGCGFANSIVGPKGVVGAMNADPLFVNSRGHDYHLSGGSPARDAVDQGPMVDFEGDARPRGIRFDIGADEAP